MPKSKSDKYDHWWAGYGPDILIVGCVLVVAGLELLFILG